jgi:hypothetical protein
MIKIIVLLLLIGTQLIAQDTLKVDTLPNRSVNTKEIKVKSVKEPKAVKEKKEEYYSGQCQATTKKGKQCSRAADGGNKYCWQHD